MREHDGSERRCKSDEQSVAIEKDGAKRQGDRREAEQLPEKERRKIGEGCKRRRDQKEDGSIAMPSRSGHRGSPGRSRSETADPMRERLRPSWRSDPHSRTRRSPNRSAGQRNPRFVAGEPQDEQHDHAARGADRRGAMHPLPVKPAAVCQRFHESAVSLHLVKKSVTGKPRPQCLVLPFRPPISPAKSTNSAA